MSNDMREKEQQQRNLVDISAIIDDMWVGMKKYWWLFLALVSICASALYFQARRSYAPYYTAYSTFTVNANVAVGYSESNYNQTVAAQIGSTFPYLISSGVLNAIIAEDLGTEGVPGSIDVTAMEDTNLITIRVTSSEPQMAYDILQSVITNYPKVGEFVFGDTKLNLMDESGAPEAPANLPAFKSAAYKGAGMGALISLILLALYAFTRNTVRKEDDLKKILNIKCLGALPKARFKRRGKVKNPLVMLDNTGIPSMFVEAARTIRTRVEKDMREQGIHTFLVTSAVPGEGKSTIAANVALSLTKRGYKVLLVDADMRKPAVVKTMGIEKSEYGFCDVLSGKVKPEEAIVRYKDTRLQVIQGGTPITNTSRILNKPETAKVMEHLAKLADCVIFDTPPSAVVSDAAMMAQYVQGAIYVVRQDYAKVDKVLEGVEMLASTGVHFTGCILNDAVVGITGYGYGYGYGYGRYGYGKYGTYGTYGYGAGGKEKQSEETGEEE